MTTGLAMPCRTSLVTTVVERRFAAITAVANPPRCPERNCRLVAKAGDSFPRRCIGVMSYAQEGGIRAPTIPPFVLLARNLVAADENYIRRYFYLIPKLKFG